MEHNADQPSLREIAQAISACQRCPLHENRRNTVPGSGPERADVMIIGEGPGEHEDRQGQPFVGPSGNILKKLLESAGMRRDEVFATNVIKCRTPNNRAPAPAEINACRPFLQSQLDILHPKLVIALGSAALKWFRPSGKITRDQGKAFINAPGQVVVPIVHPAAGMRSTQVMDSIFDAFPVVGYWREAMLTPDTDIVPAEEPGPEPLPEPSYPDPDTHGPAVLLGSWLLRETHAIETAWQETGDPSLRHRLTGLSNLISVVKPIAEREPAPELQDAVAQAIERGRRASQVIPRSCVECRHWYYPPEPHSSNRCSDCSEER